MFLGYASRCLRCALSRRVDCMKLRRLYYHFNNRRRTDSIILMPILLLWGKNYRYQLIYDYLQKNFYAISYRIIYKNCRRQQSTPLSDVKQNDPIHAII